MKNFTGKVILLLLACQSFFLFSAKAADPVLHQLIIISGGVYGAPGNYVRFAAYDPAKKQYRVFDSIPGNYTNYALVDNSVQPAMAFLSADTVVYRYNLSTYKKLDSVVVPGIQRMAILDSVLIISRGYGASGHYVQFFNKNTLKPLASDSTIPAYTDGIAVGGPDNNIYIAVRGDYMNVPDTGRIAEYDSKTLTFKRYLKIDSLRDVSALFMRGNMLYAVSPNKGRIGIYDLQNNVSTYVDVPGGAMDLPVSNLSDPGKISEVWLSSGSALTPFVFGSQSLESAKAIKGSLAAAAVDYTGDTHGERLFVTKTDYATYGYMQVLDSTGQVLDSVPTGIAPQALALDYSQSTGIEQAQQAGVLQLFPNPASSMVNLALPQNGISQLTIDDITGRQVYSETLSGGRGEFKTLDITFLPKGIYVLSLTSGQQVFYTRLIKE